MKNEMKTSKQPSSMIEKPNTDEQVKTISSLEIAELTDKDHKNVMRDLRVMMKELHGSNLSFVCVSVTYKSSNGQAYPMYLLDKETTLTLLLGYDVVARMKVVKRWTQLEAEKIIEELNPDTIIDRYKEAYRKRGKDDAWINARLRSIASRHDFTDTLKDHGVHTYGYGNCTNAIYTPLFGGGANAIRLKKNLPVKANVRDNMTSLELTSVQFAEELAKEYISSRNIQGNQRCENASYSSAKIVADAVKKNRE
jgi:phage regulator Rha-like protein